MFGEANGAVARALCICAGLSLFLASSSAVSTSSAAQISGVPMTETLAEQPYTFRPSTVLQGPGPWQFSIQNKPHWAVFDPVWGHLAGIPEPQDAGAYSGIRISVTNGTVRSSLPDFSIRVRAAADTRSVSLSWEPPHLNEDGTALTNIAGYRIYTGRSAGALTPLIELRTSGLTRYVVESLEAGTHYFAVTTVNTRGRESRLSPTISTLLP
jgi:hypothetical protein